MKRLSLVLAAAAISVCGGAQAQISPNVPTPLSSAAVTAANGAATTTGALKGNGAGAVSQAASSDLSDSGAWTSFTPTLVCSSGAVAGYAAASGRYKQYLGKTVALSVWVQASGAGTCAGTLSIGSLPATTQSSMIQELTGRDGTTGNVASCVIAPSATSCQVVTYSGATPSSTDQIVFTGIYEAN